jgi:hypothetical protein
MNIDQIKSLLTAYYSFFENLINLNSLVLSNVKKPQIYSTSQKRLGGEKNPSIENNNS